MNHNSGGHQNLVLTAQQLEPSIHHRARQVVTRHATGAADAELLLSMLGLDAPASPREMRSRDATDHAH